MGIFNSAYQAQNTSVSVPNTSTLLLSARNPGENARQEFVITNTSDTLYLYLSFGVTATTSAGIRLPPGSIYAASNSENYRVWNGDIYGICSGAGPTTVLVYTR